MYWTLLPKVKLLILEQLANALENTVQLSALNTTEVNPLQPEKASAPILVTEFGIVTDVKLVQFWKALSPTLVTEFGIVTEDIPLQP